MFCDICKKDGLVQYRVVNTQEKDWIFTCKDCWKEFAKTEGYRYGGTRKANVDVKNNYQVKQLLKIQLQKRPPIE